MLCEAYLALTPLEQSTFVGKIVHLIQSDGAFFDLGQKLIEKGENKGLFKGVTINPLDSGEKGDEE